MAAAKKKQPAKPAPKQAEQAETPPAPPRGGSYAWDPKTRTLTRVDQDLSAITEAIATLRIEDADAWTVDGKPQVAAIEAYLQYAISADDRDAAWELLHPSPTDPETET